MVLSDSLRPRCTDRHELAGGDLYGDAIEGLGPTERLRVIYESNPLERGVAAASIAGGVIAGSLRKLLRTVQRVDSLAIDEFPTIQPWFVAGMERGQRKVCCLPRMRGIGHCRR